jgi:hypothetical protein
MKTIRVEVERDYVEAILQSRRPSAAIAELIWNGLDAEATEVAVEVDRNALGEIDELRVCDNGTGLDFPFAESNFRSLGGSWKRFKPRSSQLDRCLHGRRGMGRFKAFALGAEVSWAFTYRRADGTLFSYTVSGSRDCPETFVISDEVPATTATTGTVVRIRGMDGAYPSLVPERAVPKLTEMFALYQTHYPDVGISFEGHPLEPRSLQAARTEIVLDAVVLDEGEGSPAEAAVLTLIEWNREQPRALYLCGVDGNPLHEVGSGGRVPGHAYTGYIRCEQVDQWNREGRLALDELDPDVAAMVETARTAIRRHFELQSSDGSTAALAEWMDRGLYPYEGDSVSADDAKRRAAFTVCAAALEKAVPSLKRAPLDIRRLVFRLLRDTVETPAFDPAQRLAALLALPEETARDLGSVFEKDAG